MFAEVSAMGKTLPCQRTLGQWRRVMMVKHLAAVKFRRRLVTWRDAGTDRGHPGAEPP